MKFSTALAASLGVHALLLAGGVMALRVLPSPEVSAVLDLSSVELSFSEKEEATAPIRQVSPAAAKERLAPKPPTAAPVPELETPSPAPPKAAAVKLPEPSPREEMLSPPVAVVPAREQAKIDAPPKPQAAIRPKYPSGAKRRGEQGDVVLEIAVDARGRVAAAAVVTSSGFPELDAAAAAAVKAASFTPAQAGGRTVSSSARLTVSFRLKP